MADDFIKGIGLQGLSPKDVLLDAHAQGISLKGDRKSTPKEIEKAAEDFEALLTHQMLNEMWKTVPQGGLLSNSKEEELMRDMFTQAVAKEIAEKPQGLGIKEVITKELKKQ